MGFVKLELPCPNTSPAVPSADPAPNWTLDDLLSELNSLELLLGAHPSGRPSPLKQSDRQGGDSGESRAKPFVMRVSDIDESDSDDDHEGVVVGSGTRFSCNDLYLSDSDDEWVDEEASRSNLMHRRSLEEGILLEMELERQLQLKGRRLTKSRAKPFVMCVSDIDESDSDDDHEDAREVVVGSGTRFSCNDLYLSDSDDESMDEEASGSNLMHRSLEEGILLEMELERQLQLKEQLRIKLSAIEACQLNEGEKLALAMFQLKKYTEAKRERDRKLDKQYQRRIAEMLDNHLSVIQRDHEQRSQIEERRIKNDAALEEAKRKAKALQEEKLQWEKAKAEEESRIRAAKEEEDKRAAVEAARRATEAAEKEAARTKEVAAAEAAAKEAMEQKKASGKEMKDGNLALKEYGIKIMAADAALKVEANRLKIYGEVVDKYNTVIQNFNRHARKIHICVGQISGSLENMRTKANTLLNLINSPECPRSISIFLFAKKVVSLCDNPTRSFDNIAFACGHVILLLTSQVPDVMDFVLAEFHKACMYTVPKHMQHSRATSNTKAYLTMIGYREEDGKLENSESYLSRLTSYMKLYAALVQTEIEGVRNPHGLKEGWTWLAWFLNALPANKYTAVALEAFLKMAGFSLYKRYGRQFLKILDVIKCQFLPALRERHPDAADIIARLEKYFDLKSYQKEPEGRRFPEFLLSNEYHA